MKKKTLLDFIKYDPDSKTCLLYKIFVPVVGIRGNE